VYTYKTIDGFLEFLPADELKLTVFLRNLVLDCIPECGEKLSYHVPYYYKHSNICFIWPASVTWGKKKSYEGIRFGFTKGYLLTDENGYLDRGERKEVYWRDFKHVRDIDVNILKSLLFEAVEIDKQFIKKKKK
jgi:hypothetical protein